MNLVRIIPCLDVQNGVVVKGISFRSLRSIGSPIEFARHYCNEGADELILLNISSDQTGIKYWANTVRAVRRATNIPLTVGGGIESLDDAQEMFAAGADKLSINTAAVRRPELISEIAKKYGSQSTVVAIDAYTITSHDYCIRTNGGKKPLTIDAVEWARECESRGAGEVLLTSWNADGRRLGYDVQLIQLASRQLKIPVIASGGAARSADFIDAYRAGARALLAAGILHDHITSIETIKKELLENGIPVRPIAPLSRIEELK